MTAFKLGGRLLLIVSLLTLLLSLGACVEIETDPDPPYPVKERDYSYPEPADPDPAWDHPEDFPNVRITTPKDGEVFTAGAVTVTGLYSGPELASFKINSRPVTVGANGAFSTTINVETANPVVPIMATATTAEDELISSDLVTVFVGVAKTLDDTATNGLIADLENRGLAAVGEILSELLDDTDITNILGKRVAAEKLEVLTIDRAYLGNLEIGLAGQDEGLAIDLLANGVEIDLTLLGFITLNIDINGLVMDLLAELEFDEENNISLNVLDGNFGIAEFVIDSALVPGLVNDLIELLAPLLYDLFLEDLLVDEINNLLAGLNLSFPLGDFELEVIPSGFVTTDRNVGIGIDTRVTLAEADPDFDQEAFPTVFSDPPFFGELTPDTERPYGIGLALNDDLLNQLFYAVSASGLLNFDFSDPILNARLFQVIFWSFEGIDPDMPIVLEFGPSVAPVVVGDEDGMKLVLPAYTGRTIVDRGVRGPWEAMTFAVDVEAPLDVVVNADSSLSLLLGELDVQVRIVHNPVGQKNVENIHRVFDELLDVLLPELLTNLENLTLTIPEISGLTLTVPDMTAIGDNYDYLGVFVNLSY